MCATSTCCTARRRRCGQVSIHVNAGEFVSVVGLNGAGKTTLFNAISGLVPFAGDIRVEVLSLRGRTRPIARGGVVQCPETRELFGDLSVRENLDLGGQHLASDAERGTQLAWLFELFPILKERQRQRSHIIRR